MKLKKLLKIVYKKIPENQEFFYLTTIFTIFPGT